MPAAPKRVYQKLTPFTPVCTFAGVHMSNDLWSCNVYVHMLPARFARLLATGIVLRCWLPVVELVFSVKCWLLLCCSVSLLSIYIYIYIYISENQPRCQTSDVAVAVAVWRC